MSAPLVVNTTDGTCWTQREGTRGGEALYAPEKCGSCPAFVMATLTELAEHGIAGSADVLPMPVGLASQGPRPIAYAAKNTDLLMADAAERSRAAEWPWDMWCRICHIRPTSHRTEAEALEAADRHVKLSHAPQAEVHRLMTAGGVAELDRLRARVAELEQLLADRTEPDVDGAGRTYDSYHPAPPSSVEESADKLTALFAPTQALREDEPRTCAFKNPHEPHTNEPGRVGEWQCPGVPRAAETGGVE